MMTDLSGRAVLVTGAARGIGEAVARVCAQHGAAVALVDLDPAVTDVAEDLAASGSRAVAGTVDLRSAAALADVVPRLVAHLGGLDGVVNNAGVNAYFDPVAMSEDEWEATFAVDLRAAWLVLRQTLPHLLERPGASVVNISSIHARLTVPGMFPYAAAKAGLEGLTRSLALEYGPAGVRVNAVAPGFTRTRLVEEWIEHQPDPDAARREILDRHPLKRFAEPYEVAEVVAFLLSSASGAVTGATVAVDCGLGVRF
jgi:NAD(P)-dependent dehydrogenase (short-subunit alcohol dehydrogenase family)